MRVALIAAVALALAGAARAEQPGIAVTNSPPPQIIAVPASPPYPSVILMPPGDAAVARPPGPPLPPGPRIIRPPQIRAPLHSYFTSDDYPVSARAARRKGRVDFTLIVGPDGRAKGCMINRSSGTAALDSATCIIMRRRARFTPAIDSNGNPATAPVRLSYSWRLS